MDLNELSTAPEPEGEPLSFDLDDADVAGDYEPAPAPALPRSPDALKRASRTIVQGLIATVLLAVAATVTDTVHENGVDYKLLAASATQAVLTAIVAYLHRITSPRA